VNRLRSLLAVLIVATCVACGSSGSGGTNNGAGGSSSGGRSGLASFTACLKKHGVNSFGAGQPPSGGAPPSGGSPPGSGSPPQLSNKVQKAFAACQKYMPSGGQGGFAPPGG
jgi:hypothetical protein